MILQQGGELSTITNIAHDTTGKGSFANNVWMFARLVRLFVCLFGARAMRVRRHFTVSVVFWRYVDIDTDCVA